MLPLNTQSSYSLLESNLSVADIVESAVDHGDVAVALCDKEVMYGALEFYQQASAAGLTPVLGLHVPCKVEDHVIHITFFAKNYAGYQALARLSSRLQVKDDEDGLARTDLDFNMGDVMAVLPYHAERTALLKQCKAVLLENKLNQADLYLGVTADQVSKDNLEPTQWLAMDAFTHQNSDQAAAIHLLKHIKDKSQADLGQLVKEPLTSWALSERSQLTHLYQQAGMGQALDATHELASKVDLTIPLHQSYLPEYDLPTGETSQSYLRQHSLKGLDRKGLTDDKYIQRLDKELDIIDQMGFSDYFLIVWDIMVYARRQKIQTGPGRGSAAGSLVAFALGIIDVDPIKHDLIFERFLNLERFSPPDIDLDFPDNRRQEIIDYIVKKYGRGHVASIVTFGSLGAKQALRDTGRVLGLSNQDMNAWSKTIPSQPGIHLEEAYKQSKALRERVGASSFNQQVYRLAKAIEGQPRNTSTHASGIIISGQNLQDLLPLQTGSQEIFQTQYAMEDAEAMGLMKFDILGLKNLTILDDAVGMIRDQVQTDFDLDQVNYEDQETFQIFQQADTNGVFQFESDGIRRVLHQLQPTDFEDIIAVIALYRPGPMNEISTYIQRKHGLEETRYLHDDLKEILDPTFGILIYQEQIMRVAQVFAGYSLGEADMFRRAIGHKDRELIEKEKAHFVQGAKSKGYPENQALEVYQAIERFADYGFNRSHAVAYSMLAYQLAYIKAHFPLIFYAAILRSASGAKERLYLSEYFQKGLPVQGPDINLSDASYTAKKQKLLLGLGQIKRLKKGLVKDILLDRRRKGPYQDFIDCLKRMATYHNKAEDYLPLIYSGAFDAFPQNRASLQASLEPMLANLQAGQFTSTLGEIFNPRYEERPDFDDTTRIELEFESLDLVASGHPCDQYADLQKLHDWDILLEGLPGDQLTSLAYIHDIKRIQTKKGEPMAFLTLSDSSRIMQGTLFPENYRKFHQLVKSGQTVLVTGKLDQRQQEVSILVKQVEDPSSIQAAFEKRVFIQLKNSDDPNFHKLTGILNRYPGYSPVYIHLQDSKQTYRLKPGRWLTVNDQSLEAIRGLVGPDNLALQEDKSSE